MNGVTPDPFTSREISAVELSRRQLAFVAVLACLPLPLLSLATVVFPIPAAVDRAAAGFMPFVTPAAEETPRSAERARTSGPHRHRTRTQQHRTTIAVSRAAPARARSARVEGKQQPGGDSTTAKARSLDQQQTSAVAPPPTQARSTSATSARSQNARSAHDSTTSTSNRKGSKQSSAPRSSKNSPKPSKSRGSSRSSAKAGISPGKSDASSGRHTANGHDPAPGSANSNGSGGGGGNAGNDAGGKPKQGSGGK